MVKMTEKAKRTLTHLVLITIIIFPKMLYCADSGQDPSPLIYDVSIDKDTFNPSSVEKVGIHFKLSENAKVSLKIFDFDQGHVATLCDNSTMEKGTHILVWDGRDQSGKIVPDEAYYLTIEAVQGTNRVTYDPTNISGGITHEIEKIKILSEEKQLEYILPETGRVSIKAGIVNGPLLAVPVDWEPRNKGLHRERWDGMDADRVMSVLEHPQYQIRTSYVTLPELTIITTGNKEITYFQYKQMRDFTLAKERVPLLSMQSKSILISPRYIAGVTLSKAPPIALTFSEEQWNENGIPFFQGKIPIRVDLPEKWRAFLAQKQYEIYFFLDYQFLTEDPRIQLPYQTILDLRKYPPGIHLLSLNLIGPGGQISVKNVKINLQ